VICDYEGKVLRRLSSMADAQAQLYATKSKALAKIALDAARDMDPSDQFRNIRIKTKTKELIITYDRDFIVIVVQQWTPFEQIS